MSKHDQERARLCRLVEEMDALTVRCDLQEMNARNAHSAAVRAADDARSCWLKARESLRAYDNTHTERTP